MMPGMSGIEVLRTIKQIYPDMAAVIITGHGTMDTAVEALHAGANGFLLKPFTASELRMSVEEALAKSRVVKENARLKAIMPLHESSKAFYQEMSLDRLTKVVTEQVAKGIEADQVAVLLPKEGTGLYQTQASFSQTGSPMPTINAQLLDWVVKTAEPLTTMEGESTSLPASLSGIPRLGQVVYLPLIANGVTIGILRAKKEGSEKHFTDGEIEMLTIQGSQAAIAIQNALLVRDIEDGYLSTLAVLANALEARDSETQGHCERLAKHAVLIAEAMGVQGDDVEGIRVGGLLHDIGKIGTPDNILKKPAKLTDEEYDIIKRHPAVGAKILEPIPRLAKASPIVRHHHERFDGNGYPDGLRGTEIPLGARIVTVADAFEAMTANRPYRSGQSVVYSLEELQRHRGTQFDPMVVDAFFEVLHQSHK
jgi:putative nucleotidyltransferase with HDIG domain